MLRPIKHNTGAGKNTKGVMGRNRNNNSQQICMDDIRHSRIYTIRKIFDCKKCHTQKMSHSPGIVYQTSRSIRSIIVDIFIFLNSKILVKPFLHSPIPRFPFFLLTRKSWLSLHPRTSLNPRVPFSQILDPSKIWYR